MKYSDLRVWQEAMNLVTDIYRMTKPFPSEEKFGLASQIQRAAVSVPCNIAEGQSTNAYLNHLSIAFGSLMELETQYKLPRGWNTLRRTMRTAFLPRRTKSAK